MEPHDRTEEQLTAESGEAQVKESDLYILGNLEGLNYRAVFHLSGSLVRSDSEGVQMLYLGLRSIDSKVEAVQDSVQEVITRLRW